MDENQKKQLDGIKAAANKAYYTSDKLRAIAKEFKLNEVTISYGHTKHAVYYTNEGILIAAVPTQQKRRGGFVMDPLCINSAWEQSKTKIVYALDPCSNEMWAAASIAIIEAFCNCNPAAALTKLGRDSNHCSICGAILVDELSCSRGIGPECWKKIGVKDIYREWLNKEED